MSSLMNMSLESLKELLNSSKKTVLSDQYVDAALGFASGSLGFLKDHKLEAVGAGVASLVAWYLA